MDFQATVRVTKPLNIRSMGPSISQPLARREEVGAMLRVVETVPGDLWKGEPLWYREEATDNYFWSGATKVIVHNQQALPPDPSPNIQSMGQLTPHFNIDEFLFSQTATRKGIDNKPTPEVAENLRRLAEVLETVRLLLDGVPIRISSGYRSPALNDAIGGAPKSAHMQGLAADFTAPTFGTLKDTARRIAASGLAYDQLIFEHGTWLHLGIAESGHTPKKEDLSFFGANYRKTPLFTQI